jgi:hypothetical protein
MLVDPGYSAAGILAHLCYPHGVLVARLALFPLGGLAFVYSSVVFSFDL